MSDRKLGRRASVRATALLGMVLMAAGATMASAGATPPSDEHPLDRYPGFGRSMDAAARDNAIAYWEAYRREAYVASCLEAAGYEYVPDVSYPDGAVLAVADMLDIKAASDPEMDPTERNRAYERGLEPDQRDLYFQLLYAESAADVDSLYETGMVPLGREDDFASGGCVGEARLAIGSIWDLERRIGPELRDSLGTLVASEAMTATRAEYRSCAQEVGAVEVQSPADVDAMLGTGELPPSDAIAVLNKCDAVWRSGYRAAETELAGEFADRHSTELGTAAARYANAVDDMRTDSGFLQYLSDAAARRGG